MAQTSNTLSGVTINEIHVKGSTFVDYNGDGFAGSNDQFFELINTSGATVDISGWQFYESYLNTPGVKHTFSPATTLAAGEKITVVDSGGGTTGIVNVTGTAVYSDADLSLGRFDVMALYDPVSNQYILLQGDSATALTLSDTIAAIESDHPGATQFGSTDFFGTNPDGTSIQRAGDGEDAWNTATPNPGGANVSCFLAGTWIATPECDRLVENLAPGDLILTEDGRSVPVRFNLRQSVTMRVDLPERLEPVLIRAGALADGVPHSDLIVSADHGMIVDGLIINAAALVNGLTIDFVPADQLPARVTYYNIETETHDVLLANGTAAETFIDYVGRQAFDNYRQYLDLIGCDPIITEMDRPRISARRLVPDQIKERLGIVEEEFDFDETMDWDAELRRA